MAITSLLDMHLRPEALEEASTVLADVLKDTRAFAGNEGIEVIVDVTDPAHWTAVEHWATIDHDDAYRAWRATPEGESGLGAVLAAPPTLTRYEVRSTV